MTSLRTRLLKALPWKLLKSWTIFLPFVFVFRDRPVHEPIILAIGIQVWVWIDRQDET